MTPIIVMAKAPLPGLAKTRLIPALGANGAARLAERFLRETIAAALASGVGPVTLCGTPDDASLPCFADLLRAHDLHWLAQGSGDLGARMQRAVTPALRDFGAALLIGTDAPALDAAYLRQATLALTTHDTVFAPTADGGYALIGLHQTAPALFDDMPWSTDAVMSTTRNRLNTSGVTIAELPMLHDIDQPEDLVHVPAHWLTGLPAA